MDIKLTALLLCLLRQSFCQRTDNGMPSLNSNDRHTCICICLIPPRRDPGSLQDIPLDCRCSRVAWVLIRPVNRTQLSPVLMRSRCCRLRRSLPRCTHPNSRRRCHTSHRCRPGRFQSKPAAPAPPDQFWTARHCQVWFCSCPGYVERVLFGVGGGPGEKNPPEIGVVCNMAERAPSLFDGAGGDVRVL